MRACLRALALLPTPLLASIPASESAVFSCNMDTKAAVRVCQG